MKMICDACGETALGPVQGRVLVEYNGYEGSIVKFSHHCDECGATLFLESDVRENRRAWMRFKKQFDLVPLGCEIRAMRERENLTQLEASKVFGGGPVAFSKYESDDLIPDEAMVNLLKLAIAFPDIIERLKQVKLEHVRISTIRTGDSDDLNVWDDNASGDTVDYPSLGMKEVISESFTRLNFAGESSWLQ